MTGVHLRTPHETNFIRKSTRYKLYQSRTKTRAAELKPKTSATKIIVLNTLGHQPPPPIQASMPPRHDDDDDDDEDEEELLEATDEEEEAAGRDLPFTAEEIAWARADGHAGNNYPKHLLPDRVKTLAPPPEDWCWTVDVAVKDGAPAPDNALRSHFAGEEPLKIAMCYAHIAGPGLGWMDQHKHLLGDSSLEHLDMLKQDLDSANNELIDPLLAPLVKQLLFSKWRDQGDARFADKFEEQWGHRPFFMCEVNEGGLGGTPGANNPLEGTNGAQKNEINHIRHGATEFLVQLCADINRSSMRDTEFGDVMDLPLRNARFFTFVNELIQQELSSWGCRRKRGDGWLLPSSRVVAQVEEVLAGEGKPQTAENVRWWLEQPTVGARKKKGLSWRGKFERLLDNPLAFVEEEEQVDDEWDFDSLMDWNTTYYELRPIERPKFDLFLDEMLYRLKRSGIPVNDRLWEAGGRLMRCSCRRFRRWAWCKHSAAEAIERKLIYCPALSKSDNRADLPLADKGTRARRPRKAVKGKPLTRD